MAPSAVQVALHKRLSALRQDVNEERKPGNEHKRIVMVALVRHDFKQADNALTHTDVVWINCSASKDIQALTRAYVNQQEDEAPIVVTYDTQILDAKSRISALTLDAKDTLVALRARQMQDPGALNTPSNPARAALGEITSKQRPSLRTDSAKSSSSGKAAATSQNHRTRSTSWSTPVTRQPRTSAPAGSSTSSSSTLPPHQHRPATASAQPQVASQDMAAGWEDFLAERYCLMNFADRSTKRAISSADMSGFNSRLAVTFDALHITPKTFIITRSKETAIDATCGYSTFVQRYSFWNYYFNMSGRSSAPELYIADEAELEYFQVIVSAWRGEPDNFRSKMYAKFYSECRAIEARSGISLPESRNLAEHSTTSPATRPAQVKRENPVSRLTEESAPPASSAPESESEAGALPELHRRIKDEDFHVDLEDINGPQHSGPARLSMSELFDGRTAEQLESSVESGIHLLSRIGRTLRGQPSQDSDQWLKAIETVQKQAVRSRTIVGVVGATGAGKSSVINAMLDQERLVPTNCMRACTAVVTEISYNYDGDGYRAEIEFVSRADWHKQLKILFEDLFDGSGRVSRDAAKEDSEAGVAYAQIKAVYPNLTHNDMENTTVEKLMEHKNVKCLGETRKIAHADSLIFYNKLQHYVDSKEKGQKKDKDKDKNTGREQEFWPLIRVVRLYIKAHALSTGAVIVDLPGVHDSNQARAAVAQGYMKQCTGLWIVAPITRAVDDKSAKNLMGDTFKRQLKLDGGFNDVTFICSKTDDISLTEAQDSLGLGEELGPMWSQIDALDDKKKKLQKSIEDNKTAKGDITAAMDEVDDQLDIWTDLSEKQSNGDIVYTPKPKSLKRKRSNQSSSPRKKSRSGDRDSEDDNFIDDDSDGEKSDDEDEEEESSEEQGEPLTEDQVNAKISELKSSKKEGRRQRLDVDEENKQLRREVADLDKERATIEAVISAKCIAGRNDYSREAIREDYAAGIRELDQEVAEEEDAANFDPEEDARDYDEVARNLPVFCVSSRAYQKLQGRHAKERKPPGFEAVDETEMPALQAHCIKLTAKTRLTSCRRFLTSVFQLLNSMRLWASNDGSGRNLTEGQKAHEAAILKEKLQKLDSALEDAVNTTIDDIAHDIEDKLFENMPAAIDAAKNKAVDTATGWGSHKNEGGLYWATYKATVRRDGVFTGSGGLHNFNAQLLEPVLQRLAGPWETIFSRRVPNALTLLPNTAGHLLTTFHKDQEKRAIRNGVSIASFQMLQQQIAVYRDVLKDAMDETKGKITEQQREINREPEPHLQLSMLHAYAICVAEAGPGQYNRMKVHMTSQVGQTKDTMFDDCINHIRDLIKKMLRGTREHLLEKVDEVYLAIEREYTSVVIGQDTRASGALPREQRVLRKNVLEIVDGADYKFQQAVGLAPPDEEEMEEEQNGNNDEDEQEASADARFPAAAAAVQVRKTKITTSAQDIVVNAQQEACAISAWNNDELATKNGARDHKGVKIEAPGDAAAGAMLEEDEPANRESSPLYFYSSPAGDDVEMEDAPPSPALKHSSEL